MRSLNSIDRENLPICILITFRRHSDHHQLWRWNGRLRWPWNLEDLNQFVSVAGVHTGVQFNVQITASNLHLGVSHGEKIRQEVKTVRVKVTFACHRIFRRTIRDSRPTQVILHQPHLSRAPTFRDIAWTDTASNHTSSIVIVIARTKHGRTTPQHHCISTLKQSSIIRIHRI
jgi:hypothetical protein